MYHDTPSNSLVASYSTHTTIKFPYNSNRDTTEKCGVILQHVNAHLSRSLNFNCSTLCCFHQVNYGDKVLAFFSSAAARAAPRQSEMPPLFNHNNSSSSGGVLREASSSMNFHLSGKPAAGPSHTHAHLNPHASALATTTLPQTLDEGHRRLELTDGGVGSSFSSSTEGHSGGAVDAWSDEARWRSLVVLWGGLAKRCLKASDKNSRALGERLLVSLHCHTLQVTIDVVVVDALLLIHCH